MLWFAWPRSAVIQTLSSFGASHIDQMRKTLQSLIDHRLPTSVTRLDWKDAAQTMFAPYFRRPAQLSRNIDSFILELHNLVRFLRNPEHMALMEWCLSLHRRVLRSDRTGAYQEMHRLFSNMQVSDERWLNLFQMTTPLGPGAAPRDSAFQLFQTIDGVAEGCFKPQLQIIYSFAYRDVIGAWPHEVSSQDFGAIVGNFPQTHQISPSILLRDPDMNIPINQWRNIAAHKSFSLVGPRTIQVTYGKGGTKNTRQFGLHRLRKVSAWLIKTHSAVRLANTITYIEHMREIVALGKPNTGRPLSATLLGIANGLSTVGFESVEWGVEKGEGILTVTDRQARKPQEALIHASQQLVELSVGVLADIATRSCISKVSIQLLMPDGSIFGKARVTVSDADNFSLRKINLHRYMDLIEWSLGP